MEVIAQATAQWGPGVIIALVVCCFTVVGSLTATGIYVGKHTTQINEHERDIAHLQSLYEDVLKAVNRMEATVSRMSADIGHAVRLIDALMRERRKGGDCDEC